jgi:hypothetical protein
VIEPYREDLVVAVECVFARHILAAGTGSLICASSWESRSCLAKRYT